MNVETPFSDLQHYLSAIGLTVPRLAAALMILPLLSQETVPVMVRNSLIVSLAMAIMPIATASVVIENLELIDWPFIILKECLIGAVLGFLFGAVFWALGVAGSIIDSQSGGTNASIVDPIQGHQTALIGQFMSRFASWILMASGGFMIFLNLVMSSYKIWPIQSTLPPMPDSGYTIFVEAFGQILAFGLILAAPAVIILALIDWGFGLMNRYAQNFNISEIAFPIKYFVGIAVILISLGVYVELVLTKIGENAHLLDRLRSILQ